MPPLLGLVLVSLGKKLETCGATGRVVRFGRQEPVFATNMRKHLTLSLGSDRCFTLTTCSQGKHTEQQSCRVSEQAGGEALEQASRIVHVAPRKAQDTKGLLH